MGAFFSVSSLTHDADDLRDAIRLLAKTLDDVTLGRQLDADVMHAARALVNKVQTTTEVIRSATTLGPLSTKMNELHKEDAVRDMRMQWIVINAVWVVISAATLSGAMDAIAAEYQHATDDLVEFVNKSSSSTSMTAQVQALVQTLERRQGAAEAIADEHTTLFPDLPVMTSDTFERSR